jgi:hypothetical protein
MLAFPALAMVVAQGIMGVPEKRERILLLCGLLGWANLYLFVDWVREAHVFL